MRKALDDVLAIPPTVKAQYMPGVVRIEKVESISPRGQVLVRGTGTEDPWSCRDRVPEDYQYVLLSPN